jgi:chaperonin GroEL
MKPKLVHFATAARVRMLDGINLLADAVATTLGPRGRSVLLDRRYGPPIVTRDGVTVATEIDLGDKLENLGAQLVKQIALRTSGAAGDGTTTATLLARMIFAEGVRLVGAGHDPMGLKRGVDKGVSALVLALDRLSRPVRGREEIERVATIAANGDPAVGDAVARALDRVGKDGIISVEDGRGFDTKLDFVEGMQIDRGWVTPLFVSDPARMEAVLEKALVFLYDGKLSELKQVLPVLALAQRAKRPLLVIADAVEGQALQTLVVNKQRGVLGSVAVKAPATTDKRRELLGDVAAVTGARVIAPELGMQLESLALEDLGSARQVVVDREATTIIDGGGRRTDIDSRISHVRNLIAKMGDAERERLEDRLATLVGGVAIVRVGGVTEVDAKERKARFDDSICAARAALDEGIVPGGGVAYLRAIDALDSLELPEEEQLALGILRRALEEPARWLAANAGAEPSVVVARIRSGKGALGFNAVRLRFEDLADAGVLDATKVLRIALQNAASIAGLLLTTEAVVTESAYVYEKDYLDPPMPDPKKMRPRSGQLKV